MTDSPVFLFPIAAAVIAVLAGFHLAVYRRHKRKAGLPQVSWSRLYHLGFIENFAVLAAVLAVAASGVVLVARAPHCQDGYRRLLVLAAGLSLSPRRSVTVGQRGIVYKLKFIPWARVRAKETFRRGSRILFRFKAETRAGSGRFETVMFPLPRRLHPDRPWPAFQAASRRDDAPDRPGRGKPGEDSGEA